MRCPFCGGAKESLQVSGSRACAGGRASRGRRECLQGCERPLEASELSRIVDAVEDEVCRSDDEEVPSSAIGQMVSDRLGRVDQVAYVRFARVYRQSKPLEALVDEAKAVSDAQRYGLP